MNTMLPHYIIEADIGSPNIDYSWDDYTIDTVLDYEYANQIINDIGTLSLRAKITVAIGVYEWLIGRFLPYLQSPLYLHIAQAAWVANIDKHYLYYTEIDSDDFNGPIEYAMWLGFSALLPVLYVSQNINDPDGEEYVDAENPYNPNEWAMALNMLISVTIYVLPQDKIVLFKTWLEKAITRLKLYYTQAADDPFSNLFGEEDNGDWLGDYIAREVLDLDYPYNPKDAVKLCDQFIQHVDYRNNPLLVPPEQLTGKIEHPYQLVE